MNFNRLTRADCVVPTVPPADPRCLSAEFALQNPAICTNLGALILKPGVALVCHLDSVQFRVFEYKNGVETELTTGVTYESSDDSIFPIGVNSGNGTALGSGPAVITATDGDGRKATAKLTAKPGENCCDDVIVASAIVVDNSRSMSLNFGVGYATRLAYARKAAIQYGGQMYLVDDLPKDTQRVWKFGLEAESETNWIADVAAMTAAIEGISQTQEKTNLLDVLETVVADLMLQEVDERILVIVSDGEHTTDDERQAILDAAAEFKAGGGIIICIGTRASGNGFDLLERIATGGFFLNATSDSADETLQYLSYLKSLLCAGKCVAAGDEYVNTPALDFSAFLNWEVVSGQVNLIGKTLMNFMEVDGLYVEMNGGTPAVIRTIDTFDLSSGQNYRVSFKAAGNQREDIAGMGLKVYIRQAGANDSDPNIFEQVVYPAWNGNFATYTFTFNATADATARLYFEQLYTGTAPTIGNILDDVKLEESSTLTTFLNDTFDSDNLVYVPPGCEGSAGLAEIPDPDAPTVERIQVGTTALGANEIYNVGISYVTQEGETAVSAFAQYTAENEEDVFKIICPLPTDERVIAIRVWRSLGDDPVESTLYLFAENPVNQANQFDSERRAEFEARYESSVTAPEENNTAVAAGGLGYGYYCGFYECLAAAPGEQAADDSPLPDIENNPAPVSYTSSKTVCTGCPVGFVNGPETNLVPLMTSATEPSGTVISSTGAAVGYEAWKVFDRDAATYMELVGTISGYVGYQLTAAAIVTNYTLTARTDYILSAPDSWTLEGSNNGTSWTVLDTQANIGWFGGQVRSFAFVNTTAYAYYRINITTNVSGELTSNLSLAGMELFGSVASTACATAEGQSFISQADADNQATVAATADAVSQLNCIRQYTATVTYTARCPANQYGAEITKSATRTSFTSQAEADSLAETAARELAEAELNCEGSNNGQQITINDRTGTDPAMSSPYPSVSWQEGLGAVISKVTVAINGFSANFPDDCHVVLLSPEGTAVTLFRNCGGNNAANNLNFVFDDAAGGMLPDSTALASGTFQCSPRGVEVVMPSPIPAGPFSNNLAALIGENPNGSWCLAIVDDSVGGSGTIASWSLTILT